MGSPLIRLHLSLVTLKGQSQGVGIYLVSTCLVGFKPNLFCLASEQAERQAPGPLVLLCRHVQ